MVLELGAKGNEETRLLDIIATDLSAAANGAWRTLAIDNIVLTGQTAPTVSTITSTSVDVRGAAAVTVLFDLTGATTGLVISVFGGISGFAMVQLRSVTAVAGGQGFLLGLSTTGGTQDTTGISRVDDLRIEASFAAAAGAGTGVTITLQTRFLTQPST